MPRRKIVVNFPFRTIESVRKEMGVSKKRAAFLMGLMDGIHLANNGYSTISKVHRGDYRRGLKKGLLVKK